MVLENYATTNRSASLSLRKGIKGYPSVLIQYFVVYFRVFVSQEQCYYVVSLRIQARDKTASISC